MDWPEQQIYREGQDRLEEVSAVDYFDPMITNCTYYRLETNEESGMIIINIDPEMNIYQ